MCPPRCTPAVTSLALANSGDVYVGGHFGLVNGVYRNQGAELSSTDGTVMASVVSVDAPGDLTTTFGAVVAPDEHAANSNEAPTIRSITFTIALSFPWMSC